MSAASPASPEVVRAQDGSVDRLYFATYAVTRRPLAFADLQP